MRGRHRHRGRVATPTQRRPIQRRPTQRRPTQRRSVQRQGSTMRFVFAPPADSTAGLLTLPWLEPIEEWQDERHRRDPAAGHLPAHRAVRRRRRAGLRAQGTRRAAGPARVPAAARAARPRHPGRRGARRGGRPARGPRRRTGDPVPRPLHLLPGAVFRRQSTRPGGQLARRTADRQAARRHGRTAGPAAPGRLHVGRLLAVQHAVPARRRRPGRPPGRRRDGRDPRPRSPTASATTTWTSPSSGSAASCSTCRPAACCRPMWTRSRLPRRSRAGTRPCGPS